MKKGNQQMTKIPITIPRVTAALKMKKLCEIDSDQYNEYECSLLYSFYNDNTHSASISNLSSTFPFMH